MSLEKKMRIGSGPYLLTYFFDGPTDCWSGLSKANIQLGSVLKACDNMTVSGQYILRLFVKHLVLRSTSENIKQLTELNIVSGMKKIPKRNNQQRKRLFSRHCVLRWQWNLLDIIDLLLTDTIL